ncbi:hypothetical protein BOTBODRAFT_437837 [Botryobasidium botryosum FD-172 SS1]|uniref:Uncharacterized protein n=1 Tax=Botryobasidium botryosum (strain FD-172 SS1) TaxID=930990 RepID=A0A067MUH5_BOTB1|nr:hypothetical protein BOTBODRAFT_437837 [Botryobasidium botryosum FD-172 SS1]
MLVVAQNDLKGFLSVSLPRIRSQLPFISFLVLIAFLLSLIRWAQVPFQYHLHVRIITSRISSPSNHNLPSHTRQDAVHASITDRNERRGGWVCNQIFLHQNECARVLDSSLSPGCMIVGRMISYVGPGYSIVKHSLLTKIFVTCDIISILTQSGGGFMLSGQGNKKQVMLGRKS